MKRKSRSGLKLVRTRTGLQALADTPPWDWPEDAGKRFLEVLTDRNANPQDRLIAARLAGDSVVVDEALCDALLAIVDHADESEEMRAIAAISLGPVLEHTYTYEFDDPDDVIISEQAFDRVRNKLHKLYLDERVPKLVRRRILEALVRAPQEWQSETIRNAYSSGDRDWVLTAVFAMRWLPGFETQIVEALESDYPEIEREAVQAAGNWAVDDSWEHVAALACDFEAPIESRLAAIGAIGDIRPMEARDILADLADDEDEEIAEASEEALMMVDAHMAGEEYDVEEDDDDDEGGGPVIH